MNGMNPEDESKVKCHYCHDPMGSERHYVIKNGDMVLAHKRCHRWAQHANDNQTRRA